MKQNKERSYEAGGEMRVEGEHVDKMCVFIRDRTRKGT